MVHLGPAHAERLQFELTAVQPVNRTDLPQLTEQNA